MARRRRGISKWKQKEWYTILAPKIFQEKEIGETPALSVDQVIGRTLEVNLADLTGDFNYMYTKVKFRVSEVKGKTAYAEVIGHELLRDYVKMQIRRRRSVIRAIFNVKTKDEKSLRITFLAVIQNRINSSQQRAIRKEVVDYIKKKASEQDFDKFIQDVIYGNLAREVTPLIKKIAIPKSVHIIKSKLLREAS